MTLTGADEVLRPECVSVAPSAIVLAGDPVHAARRNACRNARRASASSRPSTARPCRSGRSCGPSICGVLLPICGGSLMSGVSGPSGADRSTTSTAPDRSAEARPEARSRRTHRNSPPGSRRLGAVQPGALRRAILSKRGSAGNRFRVAPALRDCAGGLGLCHPSARG